jgi:uncharacterized protein (UPF0303 family)
MTSEYTELLKELRQQEDHELVVTTLKQFLARETR